MSERRDSWEVTGQLTDQIEINQAGNAITGVRVYFITGDGNEGVVFIPNNQFSEANAHTAIKAQAALLDKVGRLKG